MRTVPILICSALALAGCRFINIEKHDPVVFTPPDSTNTVVVVEGGWEAHYRSYGMWTSFGNLEVSVHSNGVLVVKLDDLNADVSTNNVVVVEGAGAAAGEIVEHVIEALKK